MTPPQHNRIEFTSDFGLGEVVVGFVDFSGQGISFGVPHKVALTTGTPEAPGIDYAVREYERVTVHADGKVVTHWAFGEPPAGWDQAKLPLKEWQAPWSRLFEIAWDPESLRFMQPWMDDPKPATHVRYLKVPISFVTGATASQVHFDVVRPDTDMQAASTVLSGSGQLWFLTGGWPWVLVQMSGVSNPMVQDINTVGRDYR